MNKPSRDVTWVLKIQALEKRADRCVTDFAMHYFFKCNLYFIISKIEKKGNKLTPRFNFGFIHTAVSHFTRILVSSPRGDSHVLVHSEGPVFAIY